MEIPKAKFSWTGLAILLMVAVVIVSNVYQSAHTDTKISDAKAEQIDESARQLRCLSMAFQDFLQGNQEIRDANTRWRKALVESKSALRELVYQRVILGVADSPEVRDLALAYMDATHDFIQASKDYDKAIKRYRLPDFEKRCGVVSPALKKVWFDPVKDQPHYAIFED